MPNLNELRNKNVSLEQQLDLFNKLLDELHTRQQLTEAAEWLSSFPGAVPRELQTKLDKKLGTETFPIPKEGWLASYMDYTQHSEAPTAFHFFCGAAAMGAALRRDVSLSRGYYKIYPNLGVVLVAPTGKCRKTSAIDIALDILRDADLTLILSEKITPESLVQCLSTEDEAIALVHAPEFSVLIGREKYLAGMIPLLTRLLDCPDVWTTSTIMRGKAELKNVALSCLAASTPDWLISAIPPEAFGGGFMARLLFIVQWDTPRCFARPAIPDPALRQSLQQGLIEASALKASVIFDETAGKWFDQWYYKHKQRKHEDERLAGYLERKPDNLLRLALILMASAKRTHLETSDLQASSEILKWTEHYLPGMFQKLEASSGGRDYERILNQFKKASNGRLSRVQLLRKNSYKLNARQLNEVLGTMIEAGELKAYHTPDKKALFYQLR